MDGVVGVEGAFELGKPAPDIEAGEQRDHGGQLPGAEGSLGLPNNDRVDASSAR